MRVVRHRRLYGGSLRNWWRPLCRWQPGTQAANLQGLWSRERLAPWDGKYTININAQMNYWPAEPANLAECHEPLFRLVDELSVQGAETARAYYGARGWVAHHNTDIWRSAGNCI